MFRLIVVLGLALSLPAAAKDLKILTGAGVTGGIAVQTGQGSSMIDPLPWTTSSLIEVQSAEG